MKLHKMIEMYLKYDNMHTNGIINSFISINNHVNSCIKGMLSNARGYRGVRGSLGCHLFAEELSFACASSELPRPER